MGVTRGQLLQLVRLVALGVWHPEVTVHAFARSVVAQLERRLRALTMLETLTTDREQHPVTIDLDPALCLEAITALDHALASCSHPSNRADIVLWQMALDLAVPPDSRADC